MHGALYRILYEFIFDSLHVVRSTPFEKKPSDAGTLRSSAPTDASMAPGFGATATLAQV